MTPDKINTAIAEWMGWKPGVEFSVIHGGYHSEPRPDFFNDLNAIAEAMPNVTAWKYLEFGKRLRDIVARDNSNASTSFQTFDATAPQRCEALLKTLGLWEETK